MSKKGVVSFRLVSFQSNQDLLGWTETAMHEPLALQDYILGPGGGGGGVFFPLKGGKSKKKQHKSLNLEWIKILKYNFGMPWMYCTRLLLSLPPSFS